jgi:spore germination protein YaaH
VFAFFLPSYRRHLLEQADWSALSTIAYFGLVARDGGNLGRRTNGRPDFRWTAWNGSMMDRIIRKANRTGTNVVLTVARFAWTSQGWAATTRLLQSAKARAKLAREIKVEVERRGIDGVNLDFEPIPTGQSANFVKLVREVRRRLDEIRPGLDLTVSTTGYIANYDVAGITAPGGADAIFIMAYHYNGAWSNRAGSVAPLTRRTYDVTDTVNAYLRYTTPDKLILGVPYYGYIWSTETGEAHARTRPISSRWGYPGSVIHRTATRIAREHGRRWTSVEQGPWVRWQARACSSCPLTWRQMYYEDAESAALKYDLVKRKGLRGSGIWTLGYEGTDRSMERAILDAYRVD